MSIPQKVTGSPVSVSDVENGNLSALSSDALEVIAEEDLTSRILFGQPSESYLSKIRDQGFSSETGGSPAEQVIREENEATTKGFTEVRHCIQQVGGTKAGQARDLGQVSNIFRSVFPKSGTGIS